MNMFETLMMLRMLEESKPANTWLKDRYFSNVVPVDTKKVDIDVYIGKRRIAPFVHPKIGGKTVERIGYDTYSYEPPEVSPDMITTAEDMLKRSAGESIYGAMSPDERAAQQLGNDLAELDDMITRREELMCAEALFSGQVTVIGEGYNEEIQYWSQLQAAEQPYVALGAGDRWNESTSDPLRDLREYRRKIMQSSGVTPRDAVLGTDALESLLANEAFRKQLDNRRIDQGIIDPQLLPDGVTYWGYHKDTALDLYTYDEWYIDETDGQEKPIVPLKKVLLGSANARTSMMYGCVVDVDKGSFALPRVPVSWTQRKNPAGRIVQVKSKPLPVVHQINGFFVMEVLA